MAVIKNTAAIPEIPADFHLLEITDIEVLQLPSYKNPDVIEDRINMQLRVRTEGESDDSFVAWMSAKLGDRAVFGGVTKAVLGFTPKDPEFDTDVLVGRRFKSMTSHNTRGWPTLVPGTAAPEKGTPAKKNGKTALVDLDEPAF